MDISEKETVLGMMECPECAGKAAEIGSYVLRLHEPYEEQWELVGVHKECYSCFYVWDMDDLDEQVEL